MEKFPMSVKMSQAVRDAGIVSYLDAGLLVRGDAAKACWMRVPEWSCPKPARVNVSTGGRIQPLHDEVWFPRRLGGNW